MLDLLCVSLLGPLARLESECTYETMNNFRHFGRNPWTGDQPISRPLPTQESTTQKNTWTFIHDPNVIRTHDRGVRAVQNVTRHLRPLGYRVWPHMFCMCDKWTYRPVGRQPRKVHVWKMFPPFCTGIFIAHSDCSQWLVSTDTTCCW